MMNKYAAMILPAALLLPHAASAACSDQIPAIAERLLQYEAGLEGTSEVELPTTTGKKTVDAKTLGGVKPTEAWFTDDEHGVSAAREKLSEAQSLAEAGDEEGCTAIVQDLQGVLGAKG